MDGPAPYECINPGGTSDMLILCDHATNMVPRDVAGGDLGLTDAEMARHIAYDLGARGVALELARVLDATLVASRFSRLVIDPNRGEDDPTLVMRLYDGTIVPANRRIDAAEKARRLEAYHRPYHEAIDRQIDAMIASGRDPALISVHSYTPQLVGRPLRPWHVGVLFHHDDRLARPLLAQLGTRPDLVVGANQPYSGQLEGDTLSRHGTRRGLRHVLIELRHDVIATEPEQRLWAERLAPMLETAAGHARLEEVRHG